MKITRRKGFYPEEITPEMLGDVKDKLGIDEFRYAKISCTIFENADDPTEKVYIAVNEKNLSNSILYENVSSNNREAFIQAIEIELGWR